MHRIGVGFGKITLEHHYRSAEHRWLRFMSFTEAEQTWRDFV